MKFFLLAEFPQVKNCWFPLSKYPAAVLWDMDGTLVDTEPYWIAAETELVLAAGGTWTHEDGLSLVGFPLMKSAAYIKERGGVEMSEEAIVEELLTRVAHQMRSEGIPWQPGALDV